MPPFSTTAPPAVSQRRTTTSHMLDLGTGHDQRLPRLRRRHINNVPRSRVLPHASLGTGISLTPPSADTTGATKIEDEFSPPRRPPSFHTILIQQAPSQQSTMHFSNLLTLGALATTALAMPTSPSTPLEKRATTTWSWITALYCTTTGAASTTTTSGSHCYAAPSTDYSFGIVPTANDGCTFEFYRAASCTGSSFYTWTSNVCVVPGGTIGSMKVTC
ncbi:hypothetical protein F5Y18DRAFT_439294 [Xylariaceae sp. FL1019]|nr:hypothetical protein F5Y18DRAFT_439294 [Xylariaceae sp. FL1019]